jgi:predicted DNA-binding transcriptional regulator AlpA
MMTRSVHSTRPVPSAWNPDAIPGWLNRECAAFHLGMSATFFDTLVRDGVLPQPRKIGRLRLYDRRELDAAMARITRPDEDDDDLPEPST